MSYERPAWANGAEVPQSVPPFKAVNVDVGEFVRTRDALTSAYLGLSASIDRAVKAYLDHTQVVLHGDASLNVSHLLQPFNVLTNHAQVAQMALQQGNGTVAPMMISNGGMPATPAEEVDGKKKRKKRAYKQRDPNAPKRPLTAYFRYLGENRTSIAKEIQDNPELFAASGKPGDISRVATDRWHALTKDEQEPYRAAYQAALKDYEKEVERFKVQGGKPEELEQSKIEDPAVAVAVAAGANDDDDDDDSEDDASEDSDSDAELVARPPPPPVEKSPKKSASKKSRPSNPPTVFSSINPTVAPAVAAPAPVAAPSSSPERKRKAADGEAAAKKRSRKSDVVAAADPVPAPVPAPVAPVASSPPEVEKKKKDRKKKKAE